MKKKFHPQKCQTLRIGKSNPSFDYCTTDSNGHEIKLDVVVQEKYFGMNVDK